MGLPATHTVFLDLEAMFQEMTVSALHHTQILLSINLMQATTFSWRLLTCQDALLLKGRACLTVYQVDRLLAQLIPPIANMHAEHYVAMQTSIRRRSKQDLPQW